MKKKKLSALVLASTLSLALLACGTKESSAPAEFQDSASAETEKEAETAAESENTAEPEGTAEPENTAEPQEMIVFAAASMTETMTKLGEAYMAENPNVKIARHGDGVTVLVNKLSNLRKYWIFQKISAKNILLFCLKYNLNSKSHRLAQPVAFLHQKWHQK